MPKIALIAGASGLVGSHVVRNLIDSPEYSKVISLGRRGLGWSHPKLTQLVVDFGKPLIVPAELRIDDAFCTLGTTMSKAGSKEAFRQIDYEAVLQFAKAAIAHGAKTFVAVSATGADVQSKIFYSRVKGEMEQALQKLGYSSLVILRPSLIAGDRQEKRFMEDFATIILWPLRPLMLGKLKKYRPVQAASIGRAMLSAAQLPKPGTKILESDHIEMAIGKMSAYA